MVMPFEGNECYPSHEEERELEKWMKSEEILSAAASDREIFMNAATLEAVCDDDQVYSELASAFANNDEAKYGRIVMEHINNELSHRIERIALERMNDYVEARACEI